MPQVPIIMPQLGESIAEATIVDIKVKPGDEVAADQEIIEVETNKAVMGVTTPCKGKIGNITAQVKETYPIGAVLGYVEASEADAARFTKTAPAPVQEEVAEEIPGRAEQEVEPARQKRMAARDGNGARTGGLPVPAALKGAGFLSPRLRARMLELQLTTADLSGIPGTGAGHRVTVKDLESFLQNIEKQKLSDASAIRTGVADAMRRSWSRPLATIGSSVRLDALLQDRQARDPKPGPALYAVRALALALAQNPAAAAKLVGGRVVTSDSIDIGVAVEAEDGIMVPVIRAADKTSLADLATKYAELVELARKRRVSPDMQAGGIASVSNFGTFGVEWGTPIPLPDQTLLLGLGAGKKTPSWDAEKNQFVPVTEAQIMLSFDHRSLDGGGGGRLLKSVIELLEDPAKL
jgi:pyruvate/2-oxoglutarate dehydrogenase complex dihydrolipoamide acyltransferase (E2) component